MAIKWPETVLEQLFKSNIHFRSVFSILYSRLTDFLYLLINCLVEDINDNDNDSDYANGESEEIKPKKKKKGHYCTKGHAKILFKTLKSYNEHIKESHPKLARDHSCDKCEGNMGCQV